eukprot:435948-Hanusia_phi.AAC.3
MKHPGIKQDCLIFILHSETIEVTIMNRRESEGSSSRNVGTGRRPENEERLKREDSERRIRKDEEEVEEKINLTCKVVNERSHLRSEREDHDTKCNIHQRGQDMKRRQRQERLKHAVSVSKTSQQASMNDLEAGCPTLYHLLMKHTTRYPRITGETSSRVSSRPSSSSDGTCGRGRAGV